MKLNELPAIPGTEKNRKRRGRGPGSGLGCTAGRGNKGQKSRSGGFHRVGFEGGQMPLQRRLPKRGFTNIFKKRYALVNLRDLEKRFDADADVNLESLQACGLVNKVGDGVKLLGTGAVSKAFKVTVDKASKAAIAAIEKAGGSVTLLFVEPATAPTGKAE